jgi:CubicO group peptidase (beta-lactamase class C family)
MGLWVRGGLAAAVLAVSAPVMAACPEPPEAAGGKANAHSRFLEANLRPSVSVAGSKPYTLAERMRAFSVPGISVAVIHNGRIDWAKGWGVKDSAICAPVTTQTAFQAASISKTVTALLVLQMAESGKVKLDDDIARSLTSWHLPSDPAFPPGFVTLRQLLSHTAGTGVHGFPGYRLGEKVPTPVQILDGTPPSNSPPVRLEVKPGQEWRYSGGGYVMMQLALTDLTGRPFAELAERKVFAPLHMRRSSFAQPPSSEIARDVASGHVGGSPIEGKYHVYPELGAAGLWTTPSDLARLLLAVQDAANGRRTPLIGTAVAKEMLTPVAGNWGLGFALDGSGADRRFGHDGANEGFQSMMTAFVAKGEGIVILTNGDSGRRLAGEIARAVAADYGWTGFDGRTVEEAPVPAEQLARFAGLYEVGPLSAQVTLRGGRLYSRAGGPMPERLIALTPTRFAAEDSGIVVEFDTAPDGSISGLHVVENGPPLVLKRSAAPAAALGSVPVFLRGSMNGWAATQKLAPAGEGVLATELDLAAGDYQFKLGSEDWKSVDLGSAADGSIAEGAAGHALIQGGGNVRLTVLRPGRYRFELRPAADGAATLAVRRTGP